MLSKQITLMKIAVFSASILLATNALAGEGKKHGHRGPPAQAIEACADSSVDQACEFVGRQGDTVSGTCFVPPRGDSETLACKPTGGHPKHHKDRSESKDES